MIYIFNQNEQLQAILKPDTNPTYARPAGETYYIQMQHPVPDETLAAPATACPYYDAYHTEKLNGENVFIFTVPANHPDSQYVTEGNLVTFKDLDNNWQLFEIKRVNDIHGDGLTRTAFCEHAFYELIDDFIEDKRPYNVSATYALEQALAGTRWQVGHVDDLGLNSVNFYYESVLSALQKIANTWGGELQFRIAVVGNTIAARYVDLLSRRGAETGKQFVYSKDIKSIEREVDLTQVVTALYGRGKGEQIEEGYGRRITFEDVEWSVTNGDPADKPLGQKWVGDPEALARWGRPGGRHRFGVFEDSEEEDPAVLLQKTWEELQRRKNPRITYKLDVADLERLTGYEHEKVRLGDTVRVIDRAFSPELLVEARVIEIQRDLLQPENTKITLGNFAPSLADEALKQEQIRQTVADRQGIWDRANQFNPDGTLDTEWLNGIIDTLRNEVRAGRGTVTVTDNNGILIVDDPDNPTKALRLLGGLLAISNEKDPVTGEWVWRTFGTGDGFTADLLNAGQIRTNLVQILGNSHFYWDGDYLYIVNPDNGNEQIRLSKEGIRFTQDGGQTWRVAMGFDGIRMEGQSQDGYTHYAGNGVKVYDEEGNLVAHLGSFETENDQREYGLWVGKGKIQGTVMRGNEIYSSSFSTRNPGETKAYAEINTEGDIRIYDPFGQLGMLISGGFGQGTIKWYLNGIEYATANIDAGDYQDLWIQTSRSDSGIRLETHKGQYIKIGSGGGSSIEVKAGTSGTVYVDSTMVVDDFYATGTKDAVQETENYGYRSLTARESPEAKYVDEGKACLVNGECRIELDPIFLECIEPNTSETPWLFHLTPLAPLNLYVAEIGETYFVVKDVNNALEGEFCWAVSGTRKGYAGRRFIEHKLEDIKPKQNET